MEPKRISQLEMANELSGNEILPLVQNNETKNISLRSISKFIENDIENNELHSIKEKLNLLFDEKNGKLRVIESQLNELETDIFEIKVAVEKATTKKELKEAILALEEDLDQLLLDLQQQIYSLEDNGELIEEYTKLREDLNSLKQTHNKDKEAVKEKLKDVELDIENFKELVNTFIEYNVNEVRNDIKDIKELMTSMNERIFDIEENIKILKEEKIETFGSGTSEDPWQIFNEQDLKRIGHGNWVLSDHYILMDNITLAITEESNWSPIGSHLEGWDSVFTGSFNGNNKYIKNLKTIDHDNEVAFIKQCAAGGAIKNLILDNCDFTGFSAACFSTTLEETNIINCHVINGKLNSSAITGGLFGLSYEVSIENCSFSGIIITPDNWSPNLQIGGIIGRVVKDTTIKDCYVIINISSKNAFSIGGIVGISNDRSTRIENCYSKTNINNGSKDSIIGGIIGIMQWSTDLVRNCFSIIDLSNNIDSDSYGGIVGARESGNVQNSFASNLFGSRHGSLLQLPLTETFIRNTLGWDLNTTWEWNSEVQLPKLK